ncbi:hypothetical protein CHS0354_020027 [Potamilus streckersoni]|uniref:Uncharacterized protein n=1 Tax=Potamilus streckersoni TaxID=2493646 RepID=A0AAE0VRX7_9BIVA|nr:hypothetical protein CHS0354_020027 [Potamilus streckersoni]
MEQKAPFRQLTLSDYAVAHMYNASCCDFYKLPQEAFNNIHMINCNYIDPGGVLKDNCKRIQRTNKPVLIVTL